MFCRLLIVSILLIIGIPESKGQVAEYDFSKIDEWASGLKLQDTALREFTKLLVSRAENDLEKIRAIHQFVIHFLDYDHQRLYSERYRVNQNIHQILLRRRGICSDYARLIAQMSGYAGIDCRTITGFSKQLGKNSDISETPDHVWNLVNIDNSYYLLDATWDSNTLYADDRFKREYGVDYFLTPPHLFIKNHYPVLDFFQLLDCPVAFTEFVEGVDTVRFRDSCSFSYRDSILEFYTQPVVSRKIVENKRAFLLNASVKNKYAWGHAIIDDAILIKERADSLYFLDKCAQALPLYESSLASFVHASELARLYEWQTVAYGLCHLNYAQVYYKLFHDKDKPVVSHVKDHLQKAREILMGLRESKFLITGALDQIEQQLEILE